MAAQDDIRFGGVLRHLLNERFRNRRKDFARSIHVSESALSQYVRGKATPSLSVLVAIARALDVSLDYLVLGTEPDTPAPDYGGLVGHVEEAILRAQVSTATLRDFVGRVGSSLAADVESTARRLLSENTAAVLGFGLTEPDLRVLESVSRHTRISTVDLDLDVLDLPGEHNGHDPAGAAEQPDVAPTSLTLVIGNNVRHGSEYDYVIPEGPEWRRKARRLRDAVCATSDLPSTLVARRVRFFESNRPLVPGYVMYAVDKDLVTTRTERLLDRISDFVDAETGLVALAEPPSRQSQYYALMDPRHHRRLISDHDRLISSRPLLLE